MRGGGSLGGAGEGAGQAYVGPLDVEPRSVGQLESRLLREIESRPLGQVEFRPVRQREPRATRQIHELRPFRERGAYPVHAAWPFLGPRPVRSAPASFLLLVSVGERERRPLDVSQTGA